MAKILTSRQEITTFMLGKGWKDVHGYGAAANCFKECSFNPDLFGDRGKAYGLFQWHSDRQLQFRKQYGRPLIGASVQQQLEFMNWELLNTEKRAGERLRATLTAREAAATFSSYYERPARRAHEEKVRGDLAEKWWNEDHPSV